jgi:hypothetical protein
VLFHQRVQLQFSAGARSTFVQKTTKVFGDVVVVHANNTALEELGMFVAAGVMGVVQKNSFEMDGAIPRSTGYNYQSKDENGVSTFHHIRCEAAFLNGSPSCAVQEGVTRAGVPSVVLEQSEELVLIEALKKLVDEDANREKGPQ